jgi:hypothetical protein
MRALFAFILLCACGGGAKVNPDETTAEGHLKEAEKEHAAARAALDSHEVAERTPEGGAGPMVSRGAFSATGQFTYPQKVYDPAQYHLAEAEKHTAHARAHEAAARELEHFEDAECKQLPPETRAACPMLGPAVAVDEIDRGMRVTFQPGVPVAAVIAHMRCHLAFARAHGYSDDCPLYMKGVRIDGTADGKAAMITTDVAGDVTELRRRVRRQTVIGNPPQAL